MEIGNPFTSFGKNFKGIAKLHKIEDGIVYIDDFEVTKDTIDNVKNEKVREWCKLAFEQNTNRMYCYEFNRLFGDRAILHYIEPESCEFIMDGKPYRVTPITMDFNDMVPWLKENMERCRFGIQKDYPSITSFHIKVNGLRFYVHPNYVLHTNLENPREQLLKNFNDLLPEITNYYNSISENLRNDRIHHHSICYGLLSVKLQVENGKISSDAFKEVIYLDSGVTIKIPFIDYYVPQCARSKFLGTIKAIMKNQNIEIVYENGNLSFRARVDAVVKRFCGELEHAITAIDYGNDKYMVSFFSRKYVGIFETDEIKISGFKRENEKFVSTIPISENDKKAIAKISKVCAVLAGYKNRIEFT